MIARTAVVLVLWLLPVAGCTLSQATPGASGGAARVYFLRGYLAPAGYRGQLARVAREARTPAEVVASLLRGPSAAEKLRGLISTIPPGTSLEQLSVKRGLASVALRGEREPPLDAAAQVLYSLTELPGIARLLLRFNGRPCCVYDHDRHPLRRPLTRRALAHWQGAPCHLRTKPGHGPCRRRGRPVPGRFEWRTLEAGIRATNRTPPRPATSYTVESARCRGEGRIIEGSRFYPCRIRWRGGHASTLCVGRTEPGPFLYLRPQRC